MKAFYVLWDGSHYLYNDPVLLERHGVASYTEYMGEAMQFDTLPQALDFASGLSLDVLKVEISYAYSRDLFTNKF